VESYYFIKNKVLIDFSPQEIVDCTRNTNSGCGGGNNYNSFHYFAKKGAEPLADYPV
jgi:cathepsin L